ncbi:hypothetical protein R1sor_026623 [Riccia sorocarpa]|uniref:Myb-like domain-containing protein n=1 Tax=Riccia sorocarpa TaxID=122646 RepID=A0ABD3GF71_9MARC
MSPVGDPSYMPPPATTFPSVSIPPNVGNFASASSSFAAAGGNFQSGHAASNFQYGVPATIFHSGPAGANLQLDPAPGPSNYMPTYPIRPSNLEPLPDSSPERAAEAAEPCDNGGGGDNEELEGEGDSDSDDSDEGKNTGSRTHWRDWQTMALIEAQKEFRRIISTKRGREKLTAMKDKWPRVMQFLKQKGVTNTEKQVKRKWKTLLQEHRKISDFDKKSGNPPYDSLDRAGRKKAKLPHTFPAEWISLFDSFQGDRHVNNPLCVESSSAPPRVDTDPVSDPASGPETSPPPADSRSGVANAAAESGSRSNTGVKRKKDALREASLLVEAIDRMSENNSANFEKLEKGKNEREVQRREMIRELESERQDRADVRNNKMVDVLASMVVAIGEIAQWQAVLALLLALLQLAVQMVLDSLHEEEALMAEPLIFDDESDSEGEVNTQEQETMVAVAHSIIES